MYVGFQTFYRPAVLFLGPRHTRWSGVQRHAPAASTPRKTRYPLYRRPGGPQGRSDIVILTV